MQFALYIVKQQNLRICVLNDFYLFDKMVFIKFNNKTVKRECIRGKEEAK